MVMAAEDSDKPDAGLPKKRKSTFFHEPQGSPAADRPRVMGSKRPRFKEKQPSSPAASPRSMASPRPRPPPGPDPSLLDSVDSDSDEAIGIRGVAAETGLMGSLLASAARPIETIYETFNDASESPGPNESSAAESSAAESSAAESPAAESPAAESPAAESPEAESPKAESPEAETRLITDRLREGHLQSREAESSTLGSVASAQGEDYSIEAALKTSGSPLPSMIISSEPSGYQEVSIASVPECQETASFDLKWMNSRDELIASLLRDHGLRATTLDDFIKDRCLDLKSYPVKLAKLEVAYVAYVVSPKNGHSTDPFGMPKSHQALCRADVGVEAFLFQLWRTLYPRVEASSLNAELHTGPWHELVGLIGKDWVAYIILHCHVFRPWFAGAGANPCKQHWLHLVGQLNWKQPGRKDSPRNDKSDSNPQYLSKADIMYKKTPLNRRPLDPKLMLGGEVINDASRLRSPAANAQSSTALPSPTPPKKHSKIPERLLTQFCKIAKRFKQYSAQLANNRIPLPKPQSTKHRWTSHKEVTSFVFRRARKLVPLSILGSNRNWKVFEVAVSRFVRAPGFSKVMLKPLMKGFKTNEMEWRSAILNSPSPDVSLAERIAEMVVCGLFDSVIKPLLEHHFYITEMSGDKSSIYYYEKSLWLREFDRPARLELVKRHFLRPRLPEATEADLAEWARMFIDGKPHKDRMGDTPFNNTRWRVVPKRDGSSRPIINLKGLNETTKDTHLVLQQAMESVPSRLSSWQSWITRLYQYRHRVSTGKPGVTFYTVQLDISGCYDNANRAKVSELVHRNLNDGGNTYRMQSVRVHSLVPSGRSSYRRVVRPLPEQGVDEELGRMKRDGVVEAGCAAVVQETPNSDIVLGVSTIQDSMRIFKDLSLTVAPYAYVDFTQGIPQGSSCSLDMCNMLLDDLVVQRLGKFTADPQSLLLRYVDDFLFVTTERSLALEFQSTMLRGFEDEYGVTCNVSKVRSNLHTLRPYRLHFLGYDFDAKTLDVYPRTVSPKFSTENEKHDVLKRRLSYELDYMLSALRGFKRQKMIPPDKLVHETAVTFGRALASRLDVFIKLSVPTSAGGWSRKRAYNHAVNQFMMPLVHAQHDKIRRIVKQSYAKELKRLSFQEFKHHHNDK